MIVRLIDLAEGHLALVRQWRNENRFFFRDQRTITEEDHAAWWRRYSADDRDTMYVVEVQEEGQALRTAVGALGVRLHGNGDCEVQRVVLGDKTYARRGAMQTALRKLLARHATLAPRTFLEVLADNRTAVQFYEKAGFAVTGRTSEGLLTMDLQPTGKVRGLEPLYGPQPWCPEFWEGAPEGPPLHPDPWGGARGYVFAASFDGVMEIQAAEALHAFVQGEVRASQVFVRNTDLNGAPVFNCAETGTADGFSTAFIARALENAGCGHIWTCEWSKLRSTEQPRPWPRLWEDLELAHRITPCVGDSKSGGTWTNLARVLDFIFIDSEHNIQTIMGEWAVLGPRLRRGGVVAFHDYLVPECMADVQRAVQQISDELGGAEIHALNSCRGLVWMRKP